MCVTNKCAVVCAIRERLVCHQGILGVPSGNAWCAIMECLVSSGAETFVFQFAIEKYKGEDILQYNFAYCFVWV